MERLEARSASARFLDTLRHFFHLRSQHEWADRHSLHLVLHRRRRSGSTRRGCARDDGNFRSRRNDAIRLALRSLRQPLAAFLVLRTARAFAALPALLRFFLL